MGGAGAHRPAGETAAAEIALGDEEGQAGVAELVDAPGKCGIGVREGQRFGGAGGAGRSAMVTAIDVWAQPGAVQKTS